MVMQPRALKPCIRTYLFAWFTFITLVTALSGLDSNVVTLELAYGQALEHYTGENWNESVVLLNLSLHLHRLMKEAVAFCSQSCTQDSSSSNNRDLYLRVTEAGLSPLWRPMLRASCLRKCKQSFPLLAFSPLRKEIVDNFERRTPYWYLHFAYHELNDTLNAASAAYTYLKKNPEDAMMVERLKTYSGIPDLHDSLTNFEEQKYERSFLNAVYLLNSGDFSLCVELMEEALEDYLKVYALCTAGCEGHVDVVDFEDLQPPFADACMEALRCKFKCEQNLKPNVGGYFVEKFVATMYHYLQFAYYKMNDARGAVPCAASYLLFDPADLVMNENMRYYTVYRQQWGLEQHHFSPRLEAQRHFNQTSILKEMLEYAESQLQLKDEVAYASPDMEFEGPGAHEEGIYAKWIQAPRCKWDTGESD